MERQTRIVRDGEKDKTDIHREKQRVTDSYRQTTVEKEKKVRERCADRWTNKHRQTDKDIYRDKGIVSERQRETET